MVIIYVQSNRETVSQPHSETTHAVYALSVDRQDFQKREFIPTILLPATVVKNSTQRRLIVYAYFRSGSTLTGQLFNYNPTAFYWYEPLAGVTKEFGFSGKDQLQPRNFFQFDNGTEKCV